MVFVDSELLGKLVLTAEQARELGKALSDAADEGLPPDEWDLSGFRSVFGPLDPARSETLADLHRYSRELSDAHEAEKAARA